MRESSLLGRMSFSSSACTAQVQVICSHPGHAVDLQLASPFAHPFHLACPSQPAIAPASPDVMSATAACLAACWLSRSKQGSAEPFTGGPDVFLTNLSLARIMALVLMADRGLPQAWRA